MEDSILKLLVGVFYTELTMYFEVTSRASTVG